MKVKPISVKIDGVNMGLHNYLLSLPERPLPKEPTHYVLADIINKDLSIKRVTVYFNPLDTWTNPCSQFGQNNSKAVGMLIGEHLSFLSLDPNTIAYKFWVMDIATNDVIHRGGTFDYCDWDA